VVVITGGAVECAEAIEEDIEEMVSETEDAEEELLKD
jgi:hypothetical protein